VDLYAQGAATCQVMVSHRRRIRADMTGELAHRMLTMQQRPYDLESGLVT
jgi:hypothetical protein